MTHSDPNDKRHDPVSPSSNRMRIDSRQLFASQNEIIIEHQGEEYRLRITSNGKLILTK